MGLEFCLGWFLGGPARPGYGADYELCEISTLPWGLGVCFRHTAQPGPMHTEAGLAVSRWASTPACSVALGGQYHRRACTNGVDSDPGIGAVLLRCTRHRARYQRTHDP